METALKETRDEASVLDVLDSKSPVGGGVEDTHGEDRATHDHPITPWTVSVGRSASKDAWIWLGRGHPSSSFWRELGVKMKGAFTVATKIGVPVVPITLLGTGKLMPPGTEGILNGGSIKVVIHKSIEGNDPELLCTKARNVIADALLHGDCAVGHIE